jgi:hypothetical protein
MTARQSIFGQTVATGAIKVSVDHSTGVDRQVSYVSGDHTAAPFLTIQAALAALPVNSAQRRLVQVNANASAYQGFNLSGFTGAGDVVLKFGTAVPTLTGPTSGAAGAGSTTTTCNLPTGSGTDWTTDTLRGLFIQVASTDADLPYIRPIKSKTNTSFTFDAIPGFTSGSNFNIVKAGTSLAAGASTYAGFNVGAVLASNSSVIRTLYCAPAASLDYGVYSTANAYVDHHGCQLKNAATYQTVFSNADFYSVLNDSYMNTGNTLQQNAGTLEFQNVVSDGGYGVVQANSVLVQADMASVTAGIPLTVRRSNNALVGFKAASCTAAAAILFDSCTTVLQQNAGLTGSGNSAYGAEFVNGGQYNVTGASITGASGDFSIDGSASAYQSWANLASVKAMSRYGAGTLLIGGSGTAEMTILESLQILGNNLDITNAQVQSGGRFIQYGFFHFAVGKVGGGSADGLSAHVGGGNSSATLCGLGETVFTTVTNDHDSGILNNAVIGGMFQVVANFGAHILDIYPPVGGKFNTGSTDSPYSVGAGHIAVFWSRDDGSGGKDYICFQVTP